jgi:hypothetical protein
MLLWGRHCCAEATYLGLEDVVDGRLDRLCTERRLARQQLEHHDTQAPESTP